ncbi:hypothetical protein CYLTODRAFT_489369 [Cylindrobasidium torrendii FP15055 ss-10]|uniref:Transmembrane protein n=1 Tax=Cylindrobasidium torrendii FP15055 ss-10 TaxID=1314674 RepID=A0A0D7BFR8_9AGAR|nr:hypothetical protein CYLTODRAFT_489369 [Cylindrobasidium torrendii FP15055 ss-10]
MSSWVLARKGLTTSRARLILFLANIIVFGLCTAHVVIDEKYYQLQVPYLRSQGTDESVDSLPATVRAIVDSSKHDTMILRRVCYFISDCVVVWRTWCIWKTNVWVKAFLAVLLLATFATSLSTALITLTGYTSTNLSQNMLGTFCLLFTNFATTGLCAYKVWQYRRSIQSSVRTQNSSFVDNVLLLLVESGLFYCLFWLLLLLGDFSFLETGPLGTTFGLEWFMPHFSGIYISMVILATAMYREPSDSFVSVAQTSLSRGHSTKNSTSASFSKHFSGISQAWMPRNIRRQNVTDDSGIFETYSIPDLGKKGRADVEYGMAYAGHGAVEVGSPDDGSSVGSTIVPSPIRAPSLVLSRPPARMRPYPPSPPSQEILITRVEESHYDAYDSKQGYAV